MATRLPCTLPSGRFIRFNHAEDGFHLAFFQREELCPGLEDVHLPDGKAQLVLDGNEVAVPNNLVLNLYFRPTVDSVLVLLEEMTIADIPFSVFKLGLDLAQRARPNRAAK